MKDERSQEEFELASVDVRIEKPDAEVISKYLKAPACPENCCFEHKRTVGGCYPLCDCQACR